MIIPFSGNTNHHGGTILLTACPNCGRDGTFLNTGQDLCMPTGFLLGFRYCPNPNCKTLLIAVFKSGILVRTYPGSNIKINVDNVPERIKNTFVEAVDCFSNNCFTASAIMIRKTLEEICIDKQASGVNLFKKIQDIGNKVVLPKELLDAMNELRLLGNDAAHIEATTYENIGNLELTISIEFTQEIIKAIYQYESLLSKLKGLKKQD